MLYINQAEIARSRIVIRNHKKVLRSTDQLKIVMANSIASRWRDLSGESDWKDLLHPLDLDLRRYIIHCGERCGAVGDLFNDTKASRGFGHSLYPADEFFSRAGLEIGNPFKYSVTNFFYAASDIVQSAWFGYVAVTTDDGKAVLGRRDILVAWRGTMTDSEWINDVQFFPTSASELFGEDNDPQVHSGFLSLYTGRSSNSPYSQTSARDQVREAVRKLVDKYQDEDISITVTGYSLGAALATLSAMDIVASGYNKPTGNSEKSCMVTTFTYAGPRVGNDGFKKVFEGLSDLHLLRITNSTDIVPKIPFLLGIYIHVGEELEIDTTKSDYLKSNADAHNLDVYLHGVAGVQETNGDFTLEVDHDIALINKHLDGLKDDYKIPPEWWNNENFKNMVQMDDGHWKLVDNAYVPDPPSA